MELWNLNNFSASLFFLFFRLFLWEDGKVEDSPDREETGGGKGEENIAINVVVNLRIHQQFS